jgi:hypothetical protein
MLPQSLQITLDWVVHQLVSLKERGLPDGLFSNQTQSFGTSWKAFELKILKPFMTIWHTLWPLALF